MIGWDRSSASDLQIAMEEIPLTLRLLAVVGLLAANSFFAAAEVALVSVRESRMRARAKEGDRRARMVVGLLANPDRMLAATQLGVTVASLGLGWASESTVYRAIRPLFEPIFPPQNEALLHFVSFGIAFVLITFLHMVLGEVVPKNLALERSERLALMVGTPLEIFARASGFFVSMVERSAEAISRIFGAQPSGRRKTYSSEELKLLLGVGEGEGAPAESRETMLRRAVDFYDLSVREVMVPRHEISALPTDSSLDQVIDCLVREKHSCIPVYEGSPEQIAGAIYAQDIWSFVQRYRRRQALGGPSPPFKLRWLIRRVPFVPETKLLHELLEELQQRRKQLAMVVDEFGTVVGLVTTEDAVEQVVGEIREEHEIPQPAESRPPGEPVEIDGITPILDLASQYDIELPYDAGFETLAGFLMSRLGHIPKGVETVVYQGTTFTVLEMNHNRIAKVRISPAAHPEPEPQEADSEQPAR